MQLIRSIIFSVTYFLTGAIAGTVSIILWPLPYRTRYALVMIWNHFVVWSAHAFCGIDYRVIGQRNLDCEPCVILSKHQSTWETMFLQFYFGPLSTILKRELLRIPFFGWGLALLRPIPIDRGSPIKALKKVKAQGKQRLQEGNNILVYPEGTRITYGEVGNYARSGADIACLAGVPIVPVAHNAGKCWPKKGLLKKPGTITVVIGEPISTENRTSRDIMQEVEQWIEGEISKMH